MSKKLKDLELNELSKYFATNGIGYDSLRQLCAYVDGKIIKGDLEPEKASAVCYKLAISDCAHRLSFLDVKKFRSMKEEMLVKLYKYIKTFDVEYDKELLSICLGVSSPQTSAELLDSTIACDKFTAFEKLKAIFFVTHA